MEEILKKLTDNVRKNKGSKEALNFYIKYIQPIKEYFNETGLTPVFVYKFLYNADCCESSPYTMSIHETKEGAEKAMELHKNKKLKDWKLECKKFPPAKEYPFDFDQWWGIEEVQLLP